jgi:hypothetical protein
MFPPLSTTATALTLVWLSLKAYIPTLVTKTPADAVPAFGVSVSTPPEALAVPAVALTVHFVESIGPVNGSVTEDTGTGL